MTNSKNLALRLREISNELAKHVTTSQDEGLDEPLAMKLEEFVDSDGFVSIVHSLVTVAEFKRENSDSMLSEYIGPSDLHRFDSACESIASTLKKCAKQLGRDDLTYRHILRKGGIL